MNNMNHDNFGEKSGKNFVFITKTVFLTICPRTNIVFRQTALVAYLYAPLHFTTAVFKRSLLLHWPLAGRTYAAVTGKQKIYQKGASSAVKLDGQSLFLY